MREDWNGRKVIFGHANHFVLPPVRRNLYPMIFQQPETNLTFRQQAHQFEQLLRGDCAGAFLCYFCLARRTNAELEIRGCQGDAIAFCFAQKVRKDGNGRLSLDDALREIKFAEQVVLLNRKFHLRFPPRDTTEFKPATVPCFKQGIKLVVVVVHAQKRISGERPLFKGHRLWTKSCVFVASGGKRQTSTPVRQKPPQRPWSGPHHLHTFSTGTQTKARRNSRRT